MNHDTFHGEASSSGDGSGSGRSSQPKSQKASETPNYITVGAAQPSASAAALAAMLDDSGYGGSIAGDDAGESSQGRGWHPGIAAEGLPSPAHGFPGSGASSGSLENERHVVASHIHQLFFNQNRAALGRAIGRTVQTLKGLQEMNATWPAHYPSVQRPDAQTHPRLDPRPGLVHTQTTAMDLDREILPQMRTRPGGPRRAQTVAVEETEQGESSSAAARRAPSEPRLITPQIAQEFSILKLDLKLGALSQAELVHSLEKHSIASLLDGKISQSIRHLLSLRDRIEDTSSKVLVTGDLNAGKSTFCNALLRRKVLPEDQQPCTNIFCEVLDARENGGIEEVHAVHKDQQYNRNDESTYDVYRLSELEKIVVDNDRYMQAKVYVKDVRTIDESLLNNGVVDISLIDAPGLNMDSLKTHAVFAREEEIDVVVFVVSAANHFTLSAKEFIWNAAREKAYIFIVVNGFDMIRDKDRCQRMILEQVANLSPRTFKESAELVHFVSSNAIPVLPPLIGDGGSGGAGSSGSGGGDGGGDGGDDEDPPKGKHGDRGEPGGKGKGKEKEKVRDFEDLEQALRRFVLEKRARSKLAPAKTYLQNVLGDLQTLATVNRDVAQSELDRVIRELQELEPVFNRSKKAQAEVNDDVDRTIEDICSEIYSVTRETLSSTISRVAEEDLGVTYPGLLNAFQYAEDIKAAMLDQISASVTRCEELARDQAAHGVSTIRALGVSQLGDDYGELNFRADLMFRKKRDALARQVDAPVEFWDFFDLGSLLHRQEKVAGTGMAMTVVGVLGGRMVGGLGWVDGAMGAARLLGRTKDMRRMIIPGLIMAGLATTTYLILSIPTSLPKRLATKLRTSLSTLDYTHLNANRLSTEVRRTLRYPADHLRIGLSRSVERLGQRRDDTAKLRAESDVARKYFANLLRETNEIGGLVERVDLEGPAVGVAGSAGAGAAAWEVSSAL